MTVWTKDTVQHARNQQMENSSPLQNKSQLNKIFFNSQQQTPTQLKIQNTRKEQSTNPKIQMADMATCVWHTEHNIVWQTIRNWQEVRQNMTPRMNMTMKATTSNRKSKKVSKLTWVHSDNQNQYDTHIYSASIHDNSTHTQQGSVRSSACTSTECSTCKTRSKDNDLKNNKCKPRQSVWEKTFRYLN